MNKYVKKGLCLVLATGLIASTFAGCAKVGYVTNGAIQAIHEIKDGSWLNTGEDEGATSSEDVSVLEASFVADTYGGVEFTSLDDVANYYAEAYNYTKSLTAEYKTEAGTETFYKLIGDENLNVGEVIIDGKANAVVNKLVPTIVGSLFAPNSYGLPPCNSRVPADDNNLKDDTRKNDHDFQTTEFSGEDLLDASITDNNDGTITITLQPKAAQMSLRGDDSQGKFFEVLGDIGGVVSSIEQVSFSSGTPEENVQVLYKGGTGVIKIDTKTKEIVEADYTMMVMVSVTHACIAVIKNKSATLDITYTNHYPASAEWLKEKKNIERM